MQVFQLAPVQVRQHLVDRVGLQDAADLRVGAVHDEELAVEVDADGLVLLPPDGIAEEGD